MRNFLSNRWNKILAGLRWYRKQFPLIAQLTIAVLVALWFYNFGWSGFGAYKDSDGKLIPAKTLWDWLGLLVIPAVLAIGGFWLNATVQRIERERAEKRADIDREIADDRLKEQSLQTYFDRMSELLLSGQFDNPEAVHKAKAVARARTLTMLRKLDKERKVAVLQFLYESRLIRGDTTTVILHEADFSEVNLGRKFLDEVHLEGANLKGAIFQGTSLMKAHLEKASLEEANLWFAILAGAHLEGANLKNATIYPGGLDAAILDGHTILPDGSWYMSSSSPSAISDSTNTA